MGRGRNEEKPKIRRTLARDPDLAASSRGREGKTEKVNGRGGCTGGIVCGVNVLRDSDQPGQPVQ